MQGTNKHTWHNSVAAPGETNCIHCYLNAGFFDKLNKVISSSQPKTHFFFDIVD